MIILGDDFYWLHASFNFYNIDKLIKFVNERNTSQFLIKYSTASEYFDAIEKKKNLFMVDKFRPTELDWLPLVSQKYSTV